jgi:hypothetical protein
VKRHLDGHHLLLVADHGAKRKPVGEIEHIANLAGFKLRAAPDGCGSCKGDLFGGWLLSHFERPL